MTFINSDDLKIPALHTLALQCSAFLYSSYRIHVLYNYVVLDSVQTVLIQYVPTNFSVVAIKLLHGKATVSTSSQL